MNHNFWAVEKSIYFFPSNLHTFWKITENLIIPSSILLQFLYQFEQYFCFYFVIFYVCFINASKEQRTRHSYYQKPNFCYPKQIYCFVFCFISLFSKQFLIRASLEETTSPEMRDFFPTITWQKILKTLCTLMQVSLWQFIDIPSPRAWISKEIFYMSS